VSTATEDIMPVPAGVERRRQWLRFIQFGTARVGAAMLLVIVALALVGPLISPHPPTDVVGAPFSSPSGQFPLGTDLLGRDVLSRVLHGGGSLIGLSVLATLLGYGIGLPTGLLAGYRRSWVDALIMRAVDVLLAFPPLLLLLVVATGAKANIWATVAAVGIVLAPGLTRIVRAAVLETAQRDYVEAAVARGEGTVRILRREILPNILGVILADAGLRLSYAVLLIAAVNFLGVGLQPPSADWALMIAENRQGLQLEPWMVVVPALLIAAITIAINLVSDGIARSLGTSIEAFEEEAGGR
jgi:ABC-type dipeptide/oligopeptide/nickel transport system permease subunit